MKKLAAPLLLATICISFCIHHFLVDKAFAQSISSGVAISIDIYDKNVQQGSIVSFGNKNYHLSKTAYDPTAFAVVTDNPSVALENRSGNPATNHTVLSQGKIYILVTTANGKIEKGDLITTSNTPGIGEKATQDGYVVGTALETYDSPNPKTIGLVLASLNFGYYTQPTNGRTNLIASIREALINPYLGPAGLIRYIAAALVVLVSFGVGIGYFGRIVTTGVEALGRNPLASRVIMISIVLNLVMMLAVMLVGIAIAYLILVI